MSADLEYHLVFFGCLIVAIVLHEVSHGVVALWFGDDTAKRAGRLTLNPIPHVDPFGTLILPALLILSGAGAFGWAKPVPVDPSQMRHPRPDMVWVGLAGPATNFLLAGVAAVAARFLWRQSSLVGVVTYNDLSLGLRILLAFALVNLLLGLFNLLPIPPLDGSSLIERVLPAAWLPMWWKFRPYGFIVLLVLVMATNIFGRILAPFQDALVRFVFQ